MGNIISYLEEYGHLDFKEMPFNEVDALILSQFAYLKFDGLIPKITEEKEPVSFLHIAGHMDELVVFSDERYEKDHCFAADSGSDGSGSHWRHTGLLK